VTVSIRRISLGAGYRYLMASVARGDGAGVMSSPLTRYYAESGTPPGRFLGAGLACLAGGAGVVPGAQVSEEALFRMLGKLQDPVTGQQLGRPPKAVGTAYIDGKGRVRKAPRPVAGFDLTFSAPKSVSVAWALADPGTQAVIYRAHLRAVEFVIGYAERAVFFSRSGHAGVVQEDVRGVVAAGFDHWDSRAGDPQLHTHVVVMNRAQCADGAWRTLDGRLIFKATVALSTLYNAVLSDYLTGALGWGWEPMARRHSAVPKYEVAGVDAQLQAEFSRRSGAIEDAKNALVDDFVAAHGRQPSSREVLQLRQQATISTRPDKEAHALGEQMAVWRARAARLVGLDSARWVSHLAGRNELPLLRAADLTDQTLAGVAGAALAQVAGKRATFSRMNVLAEVLRQLHGARFADPTERLAVAERATDLALDRAVPVDPPEIAVTPAALQREDGTSRFRFRGMEAYTTQATLDAEARLLAAGRCVDGPAIDPSLVAAAGAEPGTGAGLSVGQVAAVRAVVSSGRELDVLVGAAGTGKSTTMAGLRAVWETGFGPGSVIGLAPSAAAAEVLSQVVGIPTENTAKWLTENARNTDRRAEVEALQAKLWRASPSRQTKAMRERMHALIAEGRAWSLRPGQLVIIDEASMAATFDLDALTTQARAAGAKVLLVGDPAQLSPVGAGGAFSLVVGDRADVPELVDVRRFRHEWERDASLALRAGRAEAVDAYDEHGRVAGGDRDAMLDALFNAWRTDIDEGRRSLMIAGDNQTVTDLNARARAHRVADGLVTEEGVRLADGSVAGVGDLIVTRRNNRSLSTGSGWLKNGDTWTVTRICRGGGLKVKRGDSHREVSLPAGYVAESVELGYATTAHRAQGRTVATAHAFVDVTTAREPLYVMTSRGCESNRLYVDTADQPGTETPAPGSELTAVEVLQAAVADTEAEQSATATMAEHWTQAHSVGQLSAEFQAIVADGTTMATDAARELERARALAGRAELLRQRAHSQRAVDVPDSVQTGPAPSL
jgi:conjugative relaxase-like TrwC/TraI family protein